MLGLVLFGVLDCSSLAEDDRVDSLQVGGVRNQGERNFLARRCGPNVIGSKMVLDITGWGIIGVGSPGEFVKASIGLRMTFARTFKRPRRGMPIVTCFTP